MVKFLYILLVVVLLGFGLALGWRELIPRVAEQPVTAAEDFFENLQGGMGYDAYRSSSAVLQRIPFEAFEHAILLSALDRIQSVEWTDTRFSESEANLRGEFSLDDQQQVQFSVRMVRETGAWRLASMVSSETGQVFGEVLPDFLEENLTTGSATIRVPGARAVPSERELRVLLQDTLLKFNEAVDTGQFAAFYQQISSAWQQQSTPSELREIFKVFIDNRVNFSGVAGLQPIFSAEPRIAPDGILHTTGTYPDEPYHIAFDLKYVNENGRWRLFGLELSLAAP